MRGSFRRMHLFAGFSSQNLAQIFASGSQNLEKFPGFFLAPFELSRFYTCPACLSILFHTGDIQALGNCTQLTSVNFKFCTKITGACCSEERSFSRLRPSPLFLWKIPFFGVTDSALSTLYSTSLPRGLMLLSPFVLVTATPQATSRRSRSARS